MVVTLKKSGETFSFTLPPQAAEDLALVDGSTIDFHPATDPQTPTFRYASVEEAMKAYEATRPEYDEAYREFAKS